MIYILTRFSKPFSPSSVPPKLDYVSGSLSFSPVPWDPDSITDLTILCCPSLISQWQYMPLYLLNLLQTFGLSLPFLSCLCVQPPSLLIPHHQHLASHWSPGPTYFSHISNSLQLSWFLLLPFTSAHPLEGRWSQGDWN